MADHLSARFAHRSPGEGSSPLDGQRFGKAPHPHEQQRCGDSREPEHGPPRQHSDEAGADTGRHDRYEQEHRHHDRHQPRHCVALVSIADHRHAQRARSAGAEAPDEPGDDDQPPRRSESGRDRGDDVQHHANLQRSPPTEAVGCRAVEPGADGEAEEERGHQPAHPRGVGRHAELGAYIGEGGQDRVDRQGAAGHQRNDEDDELAVAGLPGDGEFGCRRGDRSRHAEPVSLRSSL